MQLRLGSVLSKITVFTRFQIWEKNYLISNCELNLSFTADQLSIVQKRKFSSSYFEFSYCQNNTYGKIGVLPIKHVRLRPKVSSANWCAGQTWIVNAQSLCQTKLTNKKYESFVRVCHGRFHDILPKEYSGTFPEHLWEDDFAIKRDA